MKEIINISIAAINLILLVRYTWLIVKGKISPSLSMWTFFTIAVGMSLITYLKKDSFSWIDNVLNATDLLLVGLISIFILIFQKNRQKPDKYDLGCLIAVLLIVGYWWLSQAHYAAHIATQLIMVIAYFPVVRQMLKAKENTEPFSVWIGLFIAPFISLFAAEGNLAHIYAGRAMVCTGLLLILMLRIELQKKKRMALSN